MSSDLSLGGGYPISFYMSSDETDPYLYTIQRVYESEQVMKQELSSNPTLPYMVVKTSFTNSFSECTESSVQVLLDDFRDSKRYVVLDRGETGNRTAYSFLFDETGNRIEELVWERELTKERMRYQFSYEPTILIDRSPKELVDGAKYLEDITVDELIKMQTPEYLLERFGGFSYSKRLCEYDYDRIDDLGTFRFVKNPEGYYEMNEEYTADDGTMNYTYIDTYAEDPYYYSTLPYLEKKMEKESQTEKVFTNTFERLKDPKDCLIVSNKKVNGMYEITVLCDDKDMRLLSTLVTFYFDEFNGKLNKIVSRLESDDQENPAMETIWEFQYNPGMTLAFTPFVPERTSDEEVNGISLDDLIRISSADHILNSEGSFVVNVYEDHQDYLVQYCNYQFVKNAAGYYEMNFLTDYSDGSFEYYYLDSIADEPYCYLNSNTGKSKAKKEDKFYDDTFTSSVIMLTENTKIVSVTQTDIGYEVKLNIYWDESLWGTHVVTVDYKKERIIKDVKTLNGDVPYIYEFKYDPSIVLRYVPEK